MAAISLFMNGTATQGGGGGGTGGLTAVIGSGGVGTRNVTSFDFGNNTCNVTGGTPPYTFEWTFTVVTNPAAIWTTGATQTLDVRVSNAGGAASVRYICTVNDSAGHQAVSNIAQYTFFLSGGGGPVGGGVP